MQLHVLGLGLFQDGILRVGGLPEGEEILICDAGLGRVALHGVSTRQAEAGQRAPREVHHHSSVVNELLEFRRSSIAVVEHEVSFSSHINRAQENSKVGRS